ncbi:energy transducer TonB [Denitromonas iodatirespirans]|uniref:Protein TonB n=1 Tax=Denitromonas iodatirespirans TaxID=2795389 RepID=A0A944DJ65_DENI1|nr:energy transducer TonB [Denitromonas iodatirespirans]MBT0959824.1 energy transducer TonB [Denitromonas iodatirespirans]
MAPNNATPAPASVAPRRASARARLAACARLLVVIGLHALALALILRAVDVPPLAPVTTIEVALITPPAPKPVSPPEPIEPPKPPPPAPKPPPPKPVVRPTPPKPVAKPAPRPAPAPSPTAISEPKEEAPPPAEAPAAPVAEAAPPVAPVKAAPGPTVAAPAPIIAARFDAAYLDNPSPRYPRLSRRIGEQGKVLLRVLVTAEGTAGEVRLQQSSGHSRLDEAARNAVSQWRFEPARQGDRPVANWVIVPIEFKLENT